MNILRSRVAAVTVGAVVVVGLGAGGAVAGDLVTGRDIQNGTVRGVDLDNGTVRVRDLAPRANQRGEVRELRVLLRQTQRLVNANEATLGLLCEERKLNPPANQIDPASELGQSLNQRCQRHLS